VHSFQAEKILREAPAGTKIYVPIRNAPRMTFTDRFWKKVQNGQPQEPSLISASMCCASTSARLLDKSGTGR
jgi:hypothetical protein